MQTVKGMVGGGPTTLWSAPAAGEGPGDNLGAISQMQFTQNVFHVDHDGVLACQESIRDFFLLCQTGG